VRAFIVIAWLLGWAMTLDGLYQRLWDAYLPWWPELWPWTSAAHGLGLGPLDTGWPLICVGCGLLGASFGLYNQRQWAYWLALLSAVLALAYAVPGALLAGLALALLALPATRRHVQPPLA
jgi:hypothetical protein